MRPPQKSKIFPEQLSVRVNTYFAILFAKSTLLLYYLKMKSNNAPLDTKTLSSYLVEIQRTGKYWFSKTQALHSTKVNELSFKRAVARLIKQKRVSRIKRDFFVILPPEYYRLGTLPAEWFIDAWMSHANRQYYVALLTAAAIHGAAHQQPQEFQVMVDKPLPLTLVGKLSIRYFYNKDLLKTPVQKLKTNTGYVNISTPESTAFDLVQYIKSSGNLGNVATVLHELSEKLNPKRLAETAELLQIELCYAQRLGFILDAIGKINITGSLQKLILNKKPRYVLLCPDQENNSLEKNSKWKILINDTIEVDE